MSTADPGANPASRSDDPSNEPTPGGVEPDRLSTSPSADSVVPAERGAPIGPAIPTDEGAKADRVRWQPRWQDWVAIGLAFIGTFLLALSAADGVGGAGLLRLVGVLALLGALVLLILMVRDRVVLAGERDDWDTFEAALPRGLRLPIPDGLNYAATFPPALADLRASGEDRFAEGDGFAQRAVLGEVGDIHFCVFQHHPAQGMDDLDDAVATVGLISLHPDREYDDLPRMEVTVSDPAAPDFNDRFEVLTADTTVADAILDEHNQAVLMKSPPFAWKVVDNQVITIDPRPRTPGEVLEFIDQRVEPLAEVIERIPARLEHPVGHDR